MGDERGIRLRCICLGDAALRGSRMSARGLCGKGSESRIARSSLSNARSSVCATTRCLRINITIRQTSGKCRLATERGIQAPSVSSLQRGCLELSLTRCLRTATRCDASLLDAGCYPSRIVNWLGPHNWPLRRRGTVGRATRAPVGSCGQRVADGEPGGRLGPERGGPSGHGGDAQGSISARNRALHAGTGDPP